MAENIYALRAILRDCKKNLKGLNLAFIDLRKAFDSVNESSIEKACLRIGIPPHLVTAVVLLTKTHEGVYDDYLEQVASSPLATKVKIADMLSNLADHPTKKQIRKYAKGLLRLTRET